MEEAGEFVMELCPADHCTYAGAPARAHGPGHVPARAVAAAFHFLPNVVGKLPGSPNCLLTTYHIVVALGGLGFRNAAYKLDAVHAAIDLSIEQAETRCVRCRLVRTRFFMPTRFPLTSTKVDLRTVCQRSV